MKYLDSIEKFYWIGIYLDDDYYTGINNSELSLKILKQGLGEVREEQQKIQ